MKTVVLVGAGATLAEALPGRPSEGVRFVDEILAGQGSGWTAQELRYVCGNAIARAITAFFRGATPC